jgi:hypothetical protein
MLTATRPRAPALLARRAHAAYTTGPEVVPGQLPLNLQEESRSPISHLAVRPLIPSLAHGVRLLGGQRREGAEALWLERTCRQLQITIREANMTSLQGLALDGRLIVVASWITSLTQRKWVLAHELGHVLVQRGRLPHCYESEEWTADWFARELLVPVSHLAALPQLSHEAAAERFDVDVAHVILQRMRLAGVTEPVIYDNQVLCPECGHCQFLPRCSCASLRRDQERKRRALRRSTRERVLPTERAPILGGGQRAALML